MRISGAANSEKGFTIVEIMIASAILMVLAFAVSTLMFNATLQQTRIEDRANDVAELHEAATTMRLKPVANP